MAGVRFEDVDLLGALSRIVDKPEHEARQMVPPVPERER